MLAEWLGKEFTVAVFHAQRPLPIGGKLTFVFDSETNVVHVCTRNTDKQSEPWRMDFATPCGVTMTFTRGTRYCTADDVKTGNAEVLASCHRLRTRDVAMRPSKVKGAVELVDMVAGLDGGWRSEVRNMMVSTWWLLLAFLLGIQAGVALMAVLYMSSKTQEDGIVPEVAGQSS